MRVGLLLSWLAAAYFLAVPLVSPRGPFGWGHYRLADLYLGTPALLVAISATLYRLNRPAGLRAAAAAFSTATALLGVEACYVFGWVGIQRPNPWHEAVQVPLLATQPDAELGFAKRPHLHWEGPGPAGNLVRYHTDAQGFRNPSGLRRAEIVFLGDSYTEGAEVPAEQTFATDVARHLGVPVANLGCGAYGPQQEVGVLRRYALGYQPRCVVWQLFEGNDLRDAERFASWRDHPPTSVPSADLRMRYADHSPLVRLLNRTLPPLKSAPYPQRQVVATLHYADGGVGSEHGLYVYYPNAQEVYRRGTAETSRALAEGAEVCRENGIRLQVVFVPVAVRVLEPWLEFAPGKREKYLPDGTVDSPRDFGHALTTTCRRLDIPLLDLTPTLREAARLDRRGLYLIDDEHFDSRGHQVVASAIVACLREQERADGARGEMPSPAGPGP